MKLVELIIAILKSRGVVLSETEKTALEKALVMKTHQEGSMHLDNHWNVLVRQLKELRGQ